MQRKAVPIRLPAPEQANENMTKLNDFLTTNKINPKRVVLASKAIESRQADDVDLIKKKKAMKDGKLEKDPVVQKTKMRSGRPVTEPTLTKAMGGRLINGPSKTRIVRAVNAVLVQKKKTEIGFRDLF